MSEINKFKVDCRVNGKHIEKLFIIVIYRLGNYFYYKDRTIINKLILILLNIIRKIFIVMLFHVEMPFKCKIGEGLKLMHPHGIILNENVVIGKNCTIFHQVTIGNNEHKNTERIAAYIGDNAYIGCGAKIIGGIKIGNNVRIGANAVLVTDIDDNCTIYSKQLIKHRI